MPDDTVIKLSDIDNLPPEEAHTSSDPSSSTYVSPAVHDSSAASGHAPDPEIDDDVDELGEEAGIEYDSSESLGIDRKVHVMTEPEPPNEDQPI